MIAKTGMARIILIIPYIAFPEITERMMKNGGKLSFFPKNIGCSYPETVQVEW